MQPEHIGKPEAPGWIRERLILGDGAVGTCLKQMGYSWQRCPEEITLSDPGALSRLARDYRHAGANWLQTNTFGAHPLRLAACGLEDRAEELNRAAVHALRTIAREDGVVAGVLGPAGLTSPKPPPREEVFEGYRRQARWLLEAGADWLMVESALSRDEALLALKAALDTGDQQVKVLVSYHPVQGPTAWKTFAGDDLRTSLQLAEEKGAAMVGVNCGDGAVQMRELIRFISNWVSGPLAYSPSAGVPVESASGLIWPEGPDEWARAVAAVLTGRLALVGGCCGTTPDYIRTLRSLIHEGKV